MIRKILSAALALTVVAATSACSKADATAEQNACIVFQLAASDAAEATLSIINASSSSGSIDDATKKLMTDSVGKLKFLAERLSDGPNKTLALNMAKDFQALFDSYTKNDGTLAEAATALTADTQQLTTLCPQ